MAHNTSKRQNQESRSYGVILRRIVRMIPCATLTMGSAVWSSQQIMMQKVTVSDRKTVRKQQVIIART
jgi:hypothetical protein